MSISHRTNRLKLVGQPAVEQLQNGRYRLTVNCSTLNSREDWYSENKDRILPDYGSLQSAEMSIDGLAPREGEAYTDMRLTKVEAGNRSVREGGDYTVELTYETIGSSFVQVKDDNTDYELNGLRRVTRTSIAEAGTDYAKTVGTSYIDHQIDSETAVRCYLASYGIDDTDSFRQVQEVYVEAGTLSETLDNVGSQKAKVIETIGADPATPDGYVLASKQESDFEGFQTNRFTFLKDNVILSESEDRVGSQMSIVQEVFNGTPTAPDGYLLANTQVSDFEGIKTNRYTFLKPSVLSQSEDKVGSQLAITIEAFGEVPTTPSGYKVANVQASDFEGIKTNRYTFLKDNVVLNTSTNTISDGVVEVSTTFFGAEGTTVGPVISRSTGDVEGIPTITVKTLQDKNGQAIGGGGVDSEFQQYVNFTYPGEVSIATDQDTITDPATGNPGYIFNSYWYSLKPPVTRKVLADVSISFQNNGNLAITDPLWSPVGWAKGTVDGLGTNYTLKTLRQTAQDKAFNEYTVVGGGNNSYSGTAGFANTPGGAVLLEGNYILPGATYSIDVSGGPGRPDGNTYTLDAQLTPAFSTADGIQYWKKTLVVATIPVR